MSTPKDHYFILNPDLLGIETMSFKTWMESSFQYITPEMEEQFNVIKDKFISHKNSIKIAHQYHSKFPLVEIKINGEKIKVLAGYDIYRSHYNDKTKTIFISYNEDQEIMIKQLWHEFGHVADPKYRSPTWGGPSERYKQDPQTNVELFNYSKEPIEFDAIGTNIAYSLEKSFLSGKKKERERMIAGLEMWLKIGGEFPYISSDVFEKWRTKPTLWKKFQSRIWNLAQKLKGMIDAG